MEDEMGDFAAPLVSTAKQRVSYDAWCECTRLLLGSVAGAGDVRSELYAAGMTPLAAAREVVFGTQRGLR
jgi:hypothetical protein